MEEIEKKEIKKLLKEALNEIKSIKKDVILEFYAKEKHKYGEMIEAITPTLFAHWLLVHYCTVTGRTMTKTHWKSEVRGYLRSLAMETIKPKNNRKIIEKMVNRIWSEYISNPETIAKITIGKFKEEKITSKTEDIIPYINDLQRAYQQWYN